MSSVLVYLPRFENESLLLPLAYIFYHQKFFKTAKGYSYVNVGCASFILNYAEILKQSIGARNELELSCRVGPLSP
jgi:hypothetical protein